MAAALLRCTPRHAHGAVPRVIFRALGSTPQFDDTLVDSSSAPNFNRAHFRVYPDVITPAEEDGIMAELKLPLNRLRYDKAHWDAVRHVFVFQRAALPHVSAYCGRRSSWTIEKCFAVNGRPGIRL
jgi:hypothetical protein